MRNEGSFGKYAFFQSNISFHWECEDLVGEFQEDMLVLSLLQYYHIPLFWIIAVKFVFSRENLCWTWKSFFFLLVCLLSQNLSVISMYYMIFGKDSKVWIGKKRKCFSFLWLITLLWTSFILNVLDNLSLLLQIYHKKVYWIRGYKYF